ncbi:MAG: hypothetical protein JXM69_17895 [Anaerolineae bacterium]|nr:hypothetical protein [Anaerolineae bacterium]
MKKHIIITLALLTFILTAIFYDELKQVIVVAGYTIAGLLIITFLLIVILLTWYLLERIRLFRARRIEAEKQAHVLTVTAGNQVFVRDTDQRAVWRVMHLEARTFSNGQYREPSELEFQQWQLFNTPHRVPNKPIELLPAQTQVDLLAVLNSVQRCLIVGASDSGKTTLLQWLVSRKLHTSRVIVIDPHAYPHKWPEGCIVVGTGRDYVKIDHALNALVGLMTKRYDEIGRGTVAEMAHPPITILIDEWRAIVFNIRNASEAIKALLTESRKAAFSVFVATHSDRAKPLGLEGEYDLKDGFAVVRLSNVNGQRRATLDTGNGERPAILPGPFASHISPTIDIDRMTFTEEDLEPQPTVIEAHIMRLYQQGESFNEIARQVWGHTGGKQTEKIKQVIAQFS